jgi:hypothetical protein
MWRTGAFLFTACTIATLIATEVARSIIHRRRERRDGIGGTQDVAMIGVGVAGLCAIAAFVCLVMLATRH